MKNFQSFELLSKLQLCQDLLSEKFDFCLVLVNGKGEEVTLPSGLPLLCYECEKVSSRCHICLQQVINQVNSSNTSLTHKCPGGLYVNVYLTSLSPPEKPLYLVSGRTPDLTAFNNHLNLLHAFYSLPLRWPEEAKTSRRVQQTSPSSMIYGLTNQEINILNYLVAGLSNKDIAQKLNISQSTVKTHVAHVLEKLKVSNRTEAATVALKHKIVMSDRHA